MSDQVEIPFDDKTTDNAVLLLAAAEELGLDPAVVRTYEGGFVAPKEVYDKAFPPKKAAKKAASSKTESEEG